MIPGGEKDALMAARKAVRSHIRAHFADMGATPCFLDAHELQVWKWAFPKGAKPRFLTQGSFAYHTLNRPHTMPPQQVDLDDGAYFTVSQIDTLKTSGSLLSKVLFREIESAVKQLVREKGWDLVTNKPACVRVIISHGAHIDIPLYVISDEEMKGLQLAQANHGAELWHHHANTVWLAHRKEGWILSDPRKVLQWVNGCVKKYGPAYRNICRYLKAWRDCQWANSSLSSICIMAIVDNALKEGGASIDSDHHDDSVLSVVECMKSQMLKGVPDPTNNGKRLDQNISPSERDDICRRIDALKNALHDALNSNLGTSDAINLLCRQFGKYFPKDSKWVIKVAVTTAGVVTPTAVVPAPRPWAAARFVHPDRHTETADASRISRDSIAWLARYYPGMRVTSANAISGTLQFRAEKDGPGKVRIYHDAVPSTETGKTYIDDEYELDIRFAVRPYGVVWPHVKETGCRLQRRAEAAGKSILYFHVFPTNGELCLAALQDVARIMQADSSLKNFFEALLIPNLYYHSYSERFGSEPWPGRAHDYTGLLENVPGKEESTLWDIVISSIAHQDLRFLWRLQNLPRDLKPNSPCFCGSGKKIKRCGHHLKAMAGANALRRRLRNSRH